MMAANLQFGQLLLFVDLNGHRRPGKDERVAHRLLPLAGEFESFGWESAAVERPRLCRHASGGPPARRADGRCLLCKTVKGRGVAFMENVPIWHYRSPSQGRVRDRHPGLRRSVREEHLCQNSMSRRKTISRLCVVVADISPRARWTISKKQFRTASSYPASPSRYDRHVRRDVDARPEAFAYTIATFALYRPLSSSGTIFATRSASPPSSYRRRGQYSTPEARTCHVRTSRSHRRFRHARL